MIGSTQLRATKGKSINWASLGYSLHEYVDSEVWEKIAPFLEPHDSVRSRILQDIFSVRYRVLANEDTLRAAGFIASSVRSYITLPALKILYSQGTIQVWWSLGIRNSQG